MSGNIIDRREHYQDRSIGSRQRFIRRNKDAIRRAIEQQIKGAKGIKELDGNPGEKKRAINLGKTTTEPRFRHGKGGDAEYVLPGNDRYTKGDVIPKPPNGGAGGGRGREAGDDGDGTDDFIFHLTREEFLDMVFDDLALPDMVKKNLIQTTVRELVHDGYTRSGPAGALDIARSVKQSLGRRIGLNRRALKNELKALLDELDKLDELTVLDDAAQKRRAEIVERIDKIRAKMKAVPFLEDLDLRYRHKEWETKPTTSAVMFALMDVSASMDDYEKTIAKYFYFLLFLFLRRNYKNVEVVFIRHTHVAAEVDEQEFFYGQETGGTVVRTALETCLNAISERYSPSIWNIYVAQASDGDAMMSDAQECVQILKERLLPLCQYYVYVQIDHQGMPSGNDPRNVLWQTYKTVKAEIPHFEMAVLRDKKHIYPAFRKLFERKRSHHTV